MFKHQKILVILGSVLTLAMTAYVSVTPATVEAREDKVTEETVFAANAEDFETDAADSETKVTEKETAAIEKETKKTAKKATSETKASETKTEAKKETKAGEAAATKPSTGTVSKPSSGNKNNASGSTSSSKNNTSGSASMTTKPSGSTSSGTTAVKPSGNTSGSASTTTKPSGNTSSGTTTSKPAAHTHTWVATTTTVHHDATGHYEDVVIWEAWDEFVYEDHFYEICNTCGADVTSDPGGHLDETMHGGYHSAYESVLVDTIHHPAETEPRWVEDSAAWDETVTTYTCSCGAAK